MRDWLGIGEGGRRAGIEAYILGLPRGRVASIPEQARRRFARRDLLRSLFVANYCPPLLDGAGRNH
jgi:hypothetical protein